MNYDFMIWGNWPSIYLWIVFFVILVIYGVNKYLLSLENLSDNKFRKFILFCIGFFFFYILIYDPWPRFVQDLFLVPINVFPHITFNLNASPFFGLIVLIAIALALYYVVRFATTKINAVIPKSAPKRA